jgi:hypothetical protein
MYALTDTATGCHEEPIKWKQNKDIAIRVGMKTVRTKLSPVKLVVMLLRCVAMKISGKRKETPPYS